MRRNSSWTLTFQWTVWAFGGVMNMSSSECSWVSWFNHKANCSPEIHRDLAKRLSTGLNQTPLSFI